VLTAQTPPLPVQRILGESPDQGLDGKCTSI
jgi:hypothetical protein